MTNPVKAEAVQDKISFEYKGETYSAPPQTEWLVETLEFMEDGKITWALRQLLDDGDWARFKSHKPQIKDLESFMTAITEAAGVQGN
jgi:hypothetical protein